MRQAISAPNDEPKERAPRCEIVRFEPDRKKDLVGFQGQVQLLHLETPAMVSCVLEIRGLLSPDPKPLNSSMLMCIPRPSIRYTIVYGFHVFYLT